MYYHPLAPAKQTGFTLVELIVVIIIIGILSVSVATRFSGASGYTEYTYQARLISALRNMQQRAMQDSRPGYCFQINFSASPVAFGPPTLNYDLGNQGLTCASAIDYDNPDYLRTSATEMADEDVTFAPLPFTYLGFDNLGRPLTDAATEANCSGGCQIEVIGQETLRVCIESQGYIYACP